MPLRFTDRIVAHLTHASYEPGSVGQLARDLRVDAEDRPIFDAAIDRLASEKRIVIRKGSIVSLPPMGDEITGVLRLNQRGFGFVVPEQRFHEGDLYIPRGFVRDAITGDRVRAAVDRSAAKRSMRGGRERVRGRVVEVLERGREQFVGVLFKDGRNWFVEPDGRSLHDPVVIRDPHAKNAKDGDKVVIELLHYPEEEYHAEGVITRVVGEAGRPDVETEAVIAHHGLRDAFPEAVSAAASQAVATFEKLLDEAPRTREDLSDRFIFTIDPPDAKDFDDAISIERDEAADTWTLGVHIADVASFVTPGSALDEEARQRGNSVYLPRLVLPMLPEALSNGVCSLQEGVPRLTKSAFITFDGKGRVLSQRVAATVIRSAKRLTYLEAQALIDGKKSEARKHARTEPEYADDLMGALRGADRLAKLLRKRRLRDGMIVLDLPDVELVFDDEGHVVDAVPEDDAFTHTIIEMFMVEANESVARLFDAIEVPILRRVHPDPTFGAMAELQLYATALRLELPDQPTRHDLARLLDATRSSPARRAVHYAVLRTFAKATYSPARVGHFALASDHYAHFTSPIRRYPDLTLHRALEAYLELTDNGRDVGGERKRRELAARLRDDDRVPDEGGLLTLGRHCSDTEREAEEAERELRDFLVMQFLKEHHLGDDVAGVVTGVGGAGIFVSIERFLVEGLVRTEDLPAAGARGDRWQVDDATGRIIARRSGAVIAIGDLVTVRIVNVDLASRHLDLTLVKLPERTDHGPAGNGPGRRGGGAKGKGKGKGKGNAKGKGKDKERASRRGRK